MFNSAAFRMICCWTFITAPLATKNSAFAEETEHTWQIEKTEQTSQQYIANSLRSGDIVSVYQDIPLHFFPLVLDRVIIKWRQPDGQPRRGVSARLLFWKGSTGELIYVHEFPVLVPGHNIVRISVECQNCLAYFNEQDGPGIFIGVQYISEFSTPVDSNSGHIVYGDGGCWPGYNSIWSEEDQAWYEGCSIGLQGNFAIRAEFRSLCSEKLGDLDADNDIDLHDYAYLQTASGLNVFDDSRIQADITDDDNVDSNDLFVFMRNMTNTNIDCPIFTNPSSPPLAETQVTDNPMTVIPGDLSDDILQIPNIPATRGDVHQNVLALSYSGLLVRGLIAVALLTMVRSCANIACQHTARLNFVVSSSKPNDLEADRIRAAIDLLRTLEDDDLWSLSGQAYFALSQPQFYNPEILGGIEVSPGSDTTFGGAAVGTFKIIVNESFVTGEHWDRWGVEGLALILFAEWQHLHQPGWTEEQCQEQLEQWRKRVGFENIAPEFTHGMSDTHEK